MTPSQSRLRIAMLGTRGIPANYGGFETCVEEVAPRLAALGHDVTVYCRVPPISYEPDVYRDVRLVKLPTIKNKYLDTVSHTLLASLHAAIHRYDVVIMFGVGNSPQAFGLRLAGLPVLLNVDGLDWKRAKWPAPARALLKFAERLATRAATRTITDSHNVRSYYRQRYGKDLDYIPYGASPGPAALNGHLSRFDLEPDGYFLYVGRLEPENRVIDIVEAARRANISRSVVIVGDAPYSSDYIAELVERGKDHVTFTGAIYGDGYWELNHNAHAYIFPVASDGTHPALIEAMACGNPVLARGIPDNRAVGGDAVRYFETVDELVELMEWADRDPDEPRRLGRAAQARARSEFNWDRVTQDYLDLAVAVNRKTSLPSFDSGATDPERSIVDWLESVAFDSDAVAAPPGHAAPGDIIEQMAIHGLGPLLGERVSSGEISISPEVDEFAANQVERNRQRLELLGDDLERLLAAFDRDGIEAIPLKGSAMLLERPDEISWRPMADIDLLVRHPVQQQVNLAYAHAGYCLPANYSTGLSGLTWKHLHYQYCEYEWPAVGEPGEHPDHPRDVESHPRVVEMLRGFRWDITGWITNNLREVNGHAVPDDRAMSLHLAVHASISALESRLRMVQIVDLLRQLERTGPAPIMAAVRKSGPLHHARFVYPALALAARHSNNTLLGEAVDWLRPYVPPEMGAWIDDASFHDLSWSTRMDHPLAGDRGRWAVNLRERGQLALSSLLPLPRDLSGRYSGEGMRAIAGWYASYYRDQLRDIRG
ncbi:MAG: nucleotidyltransferase family protein [Thermomicrobiales bacterium]